LVIRVSDKAFGAPQNPHVAMQTSLLYLASGIPILASHSEPLSTLDRGQNMSKTASIGLAPSTTLFGRLFAAIDRLLLAYAEMEIRNGDVPRCGI
jgi:hypothetical protein